MMVIGEVIKWDPVSGPAHFQNATLLAGKGKRTEAIAEAELALKDSRGTEEELRSYHAFLARTYFALRRPEEAQIHQSWIESHQQH
jgi:hypothetical protein